LGVPGQLHAAQGAVALHDVDLPLVHVLGAAVHELLDPVGDVHRAGELLLHVQAGLLRLLPAALVQQHLLADLLCVKGVFNEVDLQVAAEELRHGLLDEFVGDGLLGLVLVAGLGGEVVADQHQAVL
ncbi:Asp23/Gls24 family envelope stress response protein, partial [Dysosmobacter welbionis]